MFNQQRSIAKHPMSRKSFADHYNLNNTGDIIDAPIPSTYILQNKLNTGTENLFPGTPQLKVIPLLSECKSSLNITTIKNHLLSKIEVTLNHKYKSINKHISTTKKYEELRNGPKLKQQRIHIMKQKKQKNVL